MNQLRITCTDSDRQALRILSTLAASTTFETVTDEAFTFRDSDLVVLKNRSDRKCSVLFRDFTPQSAHVRSVILKPSRHGTRWLFKGDREGFPLILEGGESITIHVEGWKPGQESKKTERAYP